MADEDLGTLAEAQESLAIANCKLKAIQVEQTYRAISERHNRRKRTTQGIEFKGEGYVVDVCGDCLEV